MGAKITLPKSQKRITVKATTGADGCLLYDSDNLYPQRMAQYAAASGTTSNCIRGYKKFILGKGFKDPDFYKSKVNSKGLTVDQLLYKAAYDISKYQGYALHVNYDASGKKTTSSIIPFEWCRLGDWEDIRFAGKILVYHDWDRTRSKQLDLRFIQVYDAYNPDPVVIQNQMKNAGGPDKWKGQILYSTVEGRNCYPLSIFDPVIEDVYSDAGIKNFRLKSVTTSFLPSTVVSYPYEFESDEERDLNREAWEKFQGTENANRVIMLENQTKDSGIQVTSFDNKSNIDLFSKTNEDVKNSIVEAFGMPPILANIQVPGKLGTSQEMKDAYNIYNTRTVDERLMIEQDFKDVFSGWYYPINPSGDYAIIPCSFNISETEQEPLINKIGSDGVNSLISVLQSQMSPIQKINTIMIAYGISQEDATKMVLPIGGIQ